jgi:hypothetical protein
MWECMKPVRGSLALEGTKKRTTALLVALAVVLAGCNTESPLPTDHHLAHEGGLMLSDLSQSSSAQALNDLRQLTAPLHDTAQAIAAGFVLFKAPPLTADDGCISSATAGGMGYHYVNARSNNLGDDSVSLLDPEFLVYAPTNAPIVGGEQGRRLAAFDYFIPYSAKWPGPDDPNFKRKPRLSDFSTMRGLPDREFASSRFQGWMFHIWLWEHNPDGMFANWNTSVPLCAGSTF